MKKAGSVRRNVADWINADSERYRSQRDFCLKETVRAGADTIAKLMAATYLAQFQDLNGEFAQRPIYEPNFLVGYVPYSARLVTDLTNLCREGQILFHRDGTELSSPIKEIEDEWYPTKLERFRRGGAQFARLYTASRKLLAPKDEQALFEAVEQCHFRDLGLTTFTRYLKPHRRTS